MGPNFDGPEAPGRRCRGPPRGSRQVRRRTRLARHRADRRRLRRLARSARPGPGRDRFPRLEKGGGPVQIGRGCPDRAGRRLDRATARRCRNSAQAFGRRRGLRPSPPGHDHHRQGNGWGQLCASLDPGDRRRFRRSGSANRASARDAGWLRLDRLILQSRDPGASSAGFDLQADRLRSRARKRTDPRDHHSRRALLRLAGRRARQQVLPQLRRPLLRCQDHALGRRTVAQPDDRSRREPDRNAQDHRQREKARGRGLSQLPLDRARCRRHDGDEAYQRLCDPCQSRPCTQPDADRLYPGPQRQGDLPDRPPLRTDGGLQFGQLGRQGDAPPAEPVAPAARSAGGVPDGPHPHRRGRTRDRDRTS